MPKVTFIQPDGVARTIDAPSGQSLMQIATSSSVRGILGDCGGNCACATCHVYVEPDWLAKLPSPDQAERETLESAHEARPNSRLGCQIELDSTLDGIIVRVAEAGE